MDKPTRTLLTKALQGALRIDQFPDAVAPGRLPDWTRAQYDGPLLEWVSNQTSGVRLAFRTSATRIRLHLTTTRLLYPNQLPDMVPTTIHATVNGAPVASASATDGPYLNLLPPDGATLVEGRPMTADLYLGADGQQERDIEIWLPNNASTQLHDIHADRPLQPADPDRRPRWVHYGSSISHGAEAASPLSVWPVAASRELGLHITNIGLGGSAHLDPFVARTIRDSDADLVSLKIGINIANADSMKRRTFIPAVHGFLDTIREGKPDVPILVISPIIYPEQENTAGPIMFDPQIGRLVATRPTLPNGDYPDGALSLRMIRDALIEIVEKRRLEDKHLFYLDGRRLFDVGDVEKLTDGLHPDTDGHKLIAARFASNATIARWLRKTDCVAS